MRAHICERKRQKEIIIKFLDKKSLNAYKLLSAQQNVYKILNWISLNEGYIKNYLEFVKTLINKDKGTNRYLHPIYKDLLYVFNMDELYTKLLEKWNLSSDFSLQIDQINNWNALWSSSLISQLTISDIIQSDSDFTGLVVEKTIEYVNNQKEHHKKTSFRDEYLQFLKLYHIDYDERYVFLHFDNK